MINGGYFAFLLWILFINTEYTIANISLVNKVFAIVYNLYNTRELHLIKI